MEITRGEMSGSRRTSGVSEAMFKLIMIGDSGTGKSCLLTRYTKDQFDLDYKVTIGVEFASKKLDIDENYKVKLQIWDTAGQQSFRSIVKSFYRNAAAVILVYNITSKQSFLSLKSWISEARDNSPKSAIFILMGTHLDLEDEREVTQEQAEAFIKEQQIAMMFQTSAKTAVNVSRAFDEVAKQLFMRIIVPKSRPNSDLEKEDILSLDKQAGKKNACC